MNDLYFTTKTKKACKKKSLSQKVYIIRPKTSISRFWTSISSMQSIVYNQTAEDTRRGVMIYSPKGLMISTTLRAVMICHYSVMDKKRL